MKYMNVYWSKQALDLDHTTADVLAIGDSWFWYPMPGGSLITAIGDLVRPKGHNILVVGNNGAEAYDYVKGKYRGQVKDLLRLYGGTASAVLISGGGNDFAGFNDLRPLLKDDCSQAATALDCFRPGGSDGTVGFLLEKMYEHYALLITRVVNAVPATARILVHCYDYAVPDGRGVFGKQGWLKPALDDAQVPQPLQQACVNHLIDGAQAVLARIAAGAAQRVVLVDSRNTLKPKDWANELHPRPGGFKKIAAVWKPALGAVGLT